MYAIVDIAGQQFKVEKNKRVYVHRLEGAEGTTVEFDKVFLLEKDGKISVGAPTVEGARVAGKILSHPKGDKVIVFKKKRRKGYAKLNGHRQYLTEVLIQGILGKGETFVEEPTAEKKVKKATKKAEPKAKVADVEVEEKPKKTRKTTKKAE
ncbi:MAG: 50S ribosomal protein L21 [Bacteroidetes bacterium]|nr:50S ribosomal protein L21 [Bacteroidota bacterium]